MSRAARKPDRKSDIDYHKDFKVWTRDSQIRPCFGTSEKNVKIRTRSDLSTETKLRVLALLNVLRDAGISLDVGAMTYNANCQRSQVFHIKYVIPPEVYVNEFCLKYQLNLPQPISQLQQTLKDRFRKDYYGDYLRVVQEHKDLGTAVMIPGSADKLVRAPDHELLITGPVVLFNRAPFACADLSDEVIDEFEAAVVNKFGGASRDVWYSVCFYATNNAPLSNNAEMCIGAKIDETKFIQIIQPSKKTQEEFLRKHEYKEPKRQYRKL